MSKKTICEQRRAIHPRPQGDEVFWHDSIKKSEKESMGYLISYWLFIDTYLLDGNLSKFHPNETEVIEDSCGWMGDEGDFFGALIDCGFIHQTEEGFFCIFI